MLKLMLHPASHAESVRENVRQMRLLWTEMQEHGRFREEVRKLLLKCTEKEAFAEELRRSLFYYYCSKCEWEVVIGPWCGDRGTKEIKVDVYMQVMNNWDIFVDYVWNEGKKQRR